MKKLSITTVLLMFLSVFYASAQDTLYIHHNGAIIGAYPVANIDSITFSYDTTDKLVDIDGNIYRTVTINGRVWMAENLRVTKYNDGTNIPHITDDNTWAGRTSPAYCWYDNNTSNKFVYGALYNGYVATNTSKEVCPTGWHVATANDWDSLIDSLGGINEAGGKLKEIGTVHWNCPNTDAIDEVNFTALPGGFRGYHGPFDNIRNYGQFWSSTTDNSNSRFAWRFNLMHDSGAVDVLNRDKTLGYSIRCVKD